MFTAAAPIQLSQTGAPKNSKKIWWACGGLAVVVGLIVLCVGGAGLLFWMRIIPSPVILNANDEPKPAETEPLNNVLAPAPPVIPPTEAPAPTLPAATEAATEILPTEPSPSIAFGGVKLWADPALGSKVVAENVPAEGSSDGPGWERLPSHVNIQISDYPLQGTFHEPYVMVFPLEEYYATSPSAKEVVSRLQNLLKIRDAASEKSMPFLPEWNAGQAFHAAVKFVDFKNGSGVRFLTQYGQDVNPVNNQDLFYTFQGITSDGRYYISAVLPVSLATLPADDSQYPGGSYTSFSNMYADYIVKIAAELSSQPDEAYSPDLKLLDDMLASLEVKP